MRCSRLFFGGRGGEARDSFVCRMKRGEAYYGVFYHRYVNVKQLREKLSIWQQTGFSLVWTVSILHIQRNGVRYICNVLLKKYISNICIIGLLNNNFLSRKLKEDRVIRKIWIINGYSTVSNIYTKKWLSSTVGVFFCVFFLLFIKN